MRHLRGDASDAASLAILLRSDYTSCNPRYSFRRATALINKRTELGSYAMASERHTTSTPQASRYGRRISAQLFAFAQLLLGGFGFLGVFLYLADDRSNPSRYQSLFVPAWAFIFAIPLLIISALLYRNCRDQMMPLERWVFNFGCSLPLVAFAIAILVSAVGW
jgi:hypothetical protein